MTKNPNRKAVSDNCALPISHKMDFVTDLAAFTVELHQKDLTPHAMQNCISAVFSTEIYTSYFLVDHFATLIWSIGYLSLILSDFDISITVSVYIN